MKKFSMLFAVLFVSPFAADAAGTYYNGSYQSPQYRYGQPITNQSARYQTAGAKANQWPYPTDSYQYQNAAAPKVATGQNGFSLSGGITRQTANWQIDMNKAGSILHYDNISWNVFDAVAGYNFGTLKLDAGLKYGVQAGDSHMIDDDISNGGYYVDTFYWDDPDDGITGDVVLGNVYDKGLSAGTSESGSMFGFNLGFGLVDKFNVGNAKLTPSVGYRHLSYTLKTTRNAGLLMQTGYCITLPNETQCSPLVMIDEDGDGIIDSVLWNDTSTPAGDVYLGDTFSFSQTKTTHEYDTSWSGPYFAVDADYEINQNNSVNARVEFGLPAYKSTGDQPYRIDWAHPKSVEDSAGIGDAWHMGLSANWLTALTNSVKMSIGFTYDYYNVSNATAKTFLNENYYTTLYTNAVNAAPYNGNEAAAIAANDPTVLGIIELKNSCPNWVCSQDNEIESFYKSMGIRVGLSTTF